MSGGGGGGFSLALGEVGAVGLLNNTTQGEWLVVWDVQVYANPAGTTTSVSLIDFLFVTGIPPPLTVTTQATGSALLDQQAQLPGIVWSNKLNFEQGLIVLSPSLPAGGYQWVHDWPIAFIAPGDSFYVASDSNPTQTFGANYVWEVVKQL
jgi:hypothetical protein